MTLIRLCDFIKPEWIIPDMQATEKYGALRELAQIACQLGIVPDAEQLRQQLVAREDLVTTAIGEGVAIPHTREAQTESLALVLARSATGVDFEAPDSRPVHLFALILGSPNNPRPQLHLLSRTARMLRQPITRDRLRCAPTATMIYAILQEEDQTPQV